MLLKGAVKNEELHIDIHFTARYLPRIKSSWEVSNWNSEAYIKEKGINQL